MKINVKMLLPFLFLPLLLSITTGCSNKAETPVSLAIVLGAHANSKQLNLESSDLSDAVTNAIFSYGTISVISDDGVSSVICSNDYDISEQYKKASTSKLESDANLKATELFSQLSQVKADDPEVDTISSLTLAVRALSSAPGNSKKEIVIIDTGLSTGGILNFSNNLIEADPDTIANQLDEAEAIPDFQGIEVCWYQLGDTGTPQSELSSSQRNKLKAIWQAIIEKGGGTVTFSDSLPCNDDIPAADYPTVTAITLPPETSITFDPSKATVFTEEQIQFLGDSAQFVDAQTAKSVLEPVVAYMKAHSDFNALLAGTTASGRSDVCLELSLARANAVRDELISMGVSSTQIKTVGLGDNDPWHIPDQNSDGTYIETYASQNRKVVLLDATSSEAQSILALQ